MAERNINVGRLVLFLVFEVGRLGDLRVTVHSVVLLIVVLRPGVSRTDDR